MSSKASSQKDLQFEWLSLAQAELQVCVHPAWANNVRKGVQENLNTLLFRYNEDLDGVVLAYVDLKIPSHKATILPGLAPYFKTNISTNLLIFSPKVGMMLEGKVNKIEEDYIGVLVLGIFNASIAASDVRDGFQFSEKNFQKAWVNDSQQHVIKLGTIIRFVVKSVQEKDDFLDIGGSLQESETGSIFWSNKFNSDKSREHKEKPNKKRKSSEDGGRCIENGYL